jgi:hypothetical protein
LFPRVEADAMEMYTTDFMRKIRRPVEGATLHG